MVERKHASVVTLQIVKVIVLIMFVLVLMGEHLQVVRKDVIPQHAKENVLTMSAFVPMEEYHHHAKNVQRNVKMMKYALLLEIRLQNVGAEGIQLKPHHAHFWNVPSFVVMPSVNL